MLGKQGFNEWAAEYEDTVRESERQGTYPFAGYSDVLTEIFEAVGEKQQASILDIGFGTGALASALYDKGHRIFGIDFSSEMIERAEKKMPEAQLVEWDMADGLPPAFDGLFFDCIVSTYALHHLEDSDKWSFLKQLLKRLAPGGTLLIGDIAFRTKEDRQACRNEYANVWDGDEAYVVFDELEAALSNIAKCEFKAHSHCGAVIQLRPECPFCHPVYDTEQRIVFETANCWFLQHEKAQGVLEGSGVIVPKQHRPSPFDLTPQEWQETQELLGLVKPFLEQIAPDGYTLGWNVGEASNQSIGHSHLHVIPRFNDEPYAGKGLRHWLKKPENRRPGKSGDAR